jgi:hypothetical protein
MNYDLGNEKWAPLTIPLLNLIITSEQQYTYDIP